MHTITCHTSPCAGCNQMPSEDRISLKLSFFLNFSSGLQQAWLRSKQRPPWHCAVSRTHIQPCFSKDCIKRSGPSSKWRYSEKAWRTEGSKHDVRMGEIVYLMMILLLHLIPLGPDAHINTHINTHHHNHRQRLVVPFINFSRWGTRAFLKQGIPARPFYYSSTAGPHGNN